MALRFDLNPPHSPRWGFAFTFLSTGVETTTVSGAYAYGVNNGAVSLAYAFVAPISDALSRVFLFVNNTAAAGNLLVELREYDSVAGRPSSVLLGSQVVSPGTLTQKWLAIDFSVPPAIEINKRYAIVVASAGGSYGIRRRIPVVPYELYAPRIGQNNNGWGSGSIGITVGFVPLGIEFSGGYRIGSPFTKTNQSFFTTPTWKGLVIRGLTGDLIISGLEWYGASLTANKITDWALFEYSTPPNGSPLASGTVSGSDPSTITAFYCAPTVLSRGTDYRLVIKGPTSATVPYILEIEDFTLHAGALSAFGVGDGLWYLCEADSAGLIWQDYPDKYPFLAPIVSSIGG